MFLCLKHYSPTYIKHHNSYYSYTFIIAIFGIRPVPDVPFISSKALGTSYFLARMKRTSRPSGFSPNVSSTPLARSSPPSAFSLIIPLSSFTADTFFSSVSFSSSLACRRNQTSRLCL